MTRHRVWLVTLPLLLAGCASASQGATTPGASTTRHASASAPTTLGAQASPSKPTPLAECGPAPVSTGASRGLVGASLTGPATATSGSRLTVEVHLRSVDGARHVLESGAAELAVLRGGRVVGEYEGAEAPYGRQATVGPTDAAPWKVSGLLAGCPEPPVDDGAPDLTRKALPPGPYDVVAVLPDVSGTPQGDLVSAPLRVQVTVDPHALPTCGDVPTSTEPPQSRVAGQLTGPSTAKAGSTIGLQVLLRSNQGKPERLETGLPADFLVVRDGRVVGRTDGPVAGVGLDLTVPAEGTIALIDATNRHNPLFDGHFTLSGCPQPSGKDRTIVSSSPRAPLPPGAYQLVAVIADSGGVMVSQPLSVQVT